MKFDTKDFRVRAGHKVRLKHHPTKVAPLYESAKHYKQLLQEAVEELSALQQLFYAANEEALLLIFQGMDAAGKDGVIGHVMSGVNPEGCEVVSFKQPSTEELTHDFLWRTTQHLPARGRIGIFNRSYYEEVLVVRVHPELLRAEGLPPPAIADGGLWAGRYRSIVELERHLQRNGTRIIKFFLNLSKAEQRRRFLARIDRPEKNWKLSMADIKERKRWSEYQRAYEICLAETATKDAPWYVVPADDKKNARLMVSGIVRHALRDLKMSYPRAGRGRREELRSIRRLLAK
jgi:PPK2 family polyphosphate:nucleotide phosphotransferase